MPTTLLRCHAYMSPHALALVDTLTLTAALGLTPNVGGGVCVSVKGPEGGGGSGGGGLFPIVSPSLHHRAEPRR